MPSRYSVAPLDLSKLETYPLASRESKVSAQQIGKPAASGGSFRDFWQGLPDILAGRDLRELVSRMKSARENERAILWGLGAHVIKVGLSPLLVDLMERGFVSGLALNGAGIIHDFEMALVGETSEEVSESLGAGKFGMAEETGSLLNRAINEGVAASLGLGESVGAFLAELSPPYQNLSLLSNAYRLAIPVTVHVAVGTDVIHMHPQASGEAIGKGSLTDFRLFASLARGLDGGGVYLNFGSAVLLPEVFLKAVSVVRNLGYPLTDFSTANFDFIRHYRPRVNVVERPVMGSGRGFDFVGHHEILMPLLAAALLD
ncbi:MAG: hypothetical protein ACRD1Z_07925 [Vicinamibacteria bacterium]